MTISDYIEKTFPIECKGRDRHGNEFLASPVKVEVLVFKRANSNSIFTEVKCPYNTGGHGQRCKASHPREDKVGEGIACPYAVDIPYALEKKR